MTKADLIGHTEHRSPKYRNLEKLPDEEMLRALVEGQERAIGAVSAAMPALQQVIALALPRLRDPLGRLIYVGAGTSGRVAMLDGVELHPTFGWPRERAVFLLAGGAISLSEATEGAEDDEAAARAAIAEAACGPRDVVLALAASGTTPFTLAAVDAARDCGALTIGFANNPGSPLLAAADYGVLLDTGTEVLAGSTRLAAGTSQKIALNVLSTALMIRLGKVYQGQMVDMKATNAKLHRRAVTIVTNVTGCSPAEARAALEKTKFQVKLAILVVQGLSPAEAEEALRASGDDLHAAMAAFEGRSRQPADTPKDES